MQLFRTLAKNAIFDQTLILAILLFLLLLASGVAHAADTDSFFFSGVQAYRNGHYQDALNTFSKLEEERPGDPNITYYLAITHAQLGNFPEARVMYEAVIAMAPGTRSAVLAKEGLANLPADSSELLVAPPKFKIESKKQETASQPEGNQDQQTVSGQPTPENGGMSPQDVMAWQAMMTQMGGTTGQNQMNPMMMYPGMFLGNQGGNGKNGNGIPQMDPNAFSTMMMNQMLQNFDMSSSDKDR